MSFYNIVLIVSAIATCSAPLSYTSTRSAFSHQERFQQTLITIDRIRQTVPNAYIILIEGTMISQEMLHILSQRVDHIHKAFEDKTVYDYINGPYKGMGEAGSILSYLISDHFNNIKSSCLSISKISGRYYPTHNFRWVCVEDAILCHLKNDNPHHPTGIWMSTMFYTIGHKVFQKYIDSIQECVSNSELKTGIALEHVLPNCLKNINTPIVIKIPFHVGGEYGPWGGYVEH